ncbi:MAG TPA: hypothetical protein VGJ26_09540, partial [Pirellulales bacterium]
MARAENQGLQIALILFVMLTIVLGVMTFLYFRSYDEERTKNGALVAEAEKQGKLAASTLKEIDVLKGLIGFPLETTTEQIKTAADEDMKLYAAAMPAVEQHYHQALLSIAGTLVETSEARNAVEVKYTELQKTHLNREAAKEPIIKKFEDLAQERTNNASELSADYNSQYAKFKQETEVLATAKNQQVAALAQLEDKSKAVQQE